MSASESSALSDAPTDAATLPSSASESLAASDEADAQVSVADSVDESLTTADDTSATGEDALDEAAALEDAADAQVDSADSADEALSTSDDQSIEEVFGLFISGLTRNQYGFPLPGVTVSAFRTSDSAPAGVATSAGDGSFSVGVRAGAHYLVAYKTGSPDVSGTTANDLIGV